MVDISTEQVKSLRDATGISVMQCKKALEEAGGDAEKARILLRKRGADAAEKKAGRTLLSGVIASYIHGNGTVGAMLELSCETDFVAQNEEFRELAHQLAMQVAASAPQFVRREEITDEAMRAAREAFAKETEGKPAALQEKILVGKIDAYFGEKILMEQPFIKDTEQSVRSLIEGATQKFSEKIAVTRFARFSVRGN